ncbi:DUF4145 domain-containing protein [Burkholderia sp. 22313]|uniref:DUF4145 domain-containing protein n=1 Tax=Burkholderia sp. 22313 TaxID=3453908 RepID=UPI003F84EBDD
MREIKLSDAITGPATRRLGTPPCPGLPCLCPKVERGVSTWADALRVERNIGAHASDVQTTREDAQDIIDFTVAIFEYVYTLADKYERYLERKRGSS